MGCVSVGESGVVVRERGVTEGMGVSVTAGITGEVTQAARKAKARTSKYKTDFFLNIELLFFIEFFLLDKFIKI